MKHRNPIRTLQATHSEILYSVPRNMMTMKENGSVSEMSLLLLLLLLVWDFLRYNMNLDLNVRSLNAFEPCVLAYLVKDHSVLFSVSYLITDSSIAIELVLRNE